MTVEARRLDFFRTANGANMNPFSGGYNLTPLSGTTTESLVPMYNNSVAGVSDSFPAKAAVKVGSGLTHANHLPVSRKRSRDPMNPMMACQTQNGNRCGSFTFLGEDVSLQMFQHQSEIDRLIAQHVRF